MNRKRCLRWASIAVLLVGPLLLGRGDDLELRRERVATMSPVERAKLANNLLWFENLDAAERERIDQLHRDIEKNADAEQLRQVMRRYCDWLATLPSTTRFELLELAPAKRIERIKLLKQQEQDNQGLRRWVEEFTARADPTPPHEHTPAETRDRRDPRHTQRLRDRFENVRRRRSDLTAEDLAEIRNYLSPTTAARLASMSPDKQSLWVWRQVSQNFWQDWINRQLAGPQSDVSVAELTEFFERLPDTQRETLLSLPGGEMYDKLRVMYQQQQKPPGLPFRPRGPRPDGPPPDGPLDRRGGPPPPPPD